MPVNIGSSLGPVRAPRGTTGDTATVALSGVADAHATVLARYLPSGL
jgi:hypothetical protein